ncbi:unnamed protein product [Prorocentrum cordatum]|uniref:Protein-tyrosine sulfotransferase n=1 Tax=Prorocentrum cordatum TaxID=2364126 RepID=A0ABN9Q516_9DINO|nr:unnamed protein product [Polarella glacialis]
MADERRSSAAPAAGDARRRAAELLRRGLLEDAPRAGPAAEDPPADGPAGEAVAAGAALAAALVQKLQGAAAPRQAAGALEALRGLRGVRMTPALLRLTGAGRVLSRQCWRGHADTEVRALVSELLASWRSAARRCRGEGRAGWRPAGDDAAAGGGQPCAAEQGGGRSAAEAARELERAVFEAGLGPGGYRAKVRALAAALRRAPAEARARARTGELPARLLAAAGGEEHLRSDSQRKRRAEESLQCLEACLGARVGGPGRHVLGIDCAGRDCHEECERRHLDARERERGGWPTLPESQLLLCVGPERSGSTWLYNAVRLLHIESRVPCDSYWIARLTREKLAERLAARPPAVVCVKTHDWHAGYEDLVGQASRVLLTHRDLRGVCASYRRVKWDVGIPDAYVESHMQWRRHHTMDIAFEDILCAGREALHRLAQHLGLPVAGDPGGLEAVHSRLCGLRRSHLGNAVCQVTKLWPDHVSDAARRLRDKVAAGAAHPRAEELNALRDPEYEQVLNSRFCAYQALYGYA